MRLAQDYAVMVRRAPGRDLVVRTIARRDANGMPLMSADIVIAGRETRDKFPAARTYPLHFRKTYYPARLHGDPREEFERQREAAALIGLPEPIGCTYDTFRTCLLPGTPYARLSPFGVEPEESNITRARELPLASAAGLWHCSIRVRADADAARGRARARRCRAAQLHRVRLAARDRDDRLRGLGTARRARARRVGGALYQGLRADAA